MSGSPKVKVLIVDRYFDLSYAAVMREQFPHVEVVHGKNFGEVRDALHEAEVMIALGHLFDEDIVACACALKWIQALTTGTDAIEGLRSLRADTILTSARGIHAPQMSEMAFAHMLSLTHRLPDMWINQQRADWVRWPQALLFEKTAVILGTGVIASGLAKKCKAFDMQVIGVSATPRDVAFFDAVLPRSAMADAIAGADYVVSLLPANKENNGLANARFFSNMKPGAFFINMSRGSIVNEVDLVRALNHGTIAGAGLDAFSTEPLPREHAFWNTPNLIVSPKHGGTTEIYVKQVRPILERNMAAYLEGRIDKMVNRIQ